MMPIIFPHEMAVYLQTQDLWPDSESERQRTEFYWEHFANVDAEWAREQPYGGQSPRPVGLYGDDAVYNVAGDKIHIVTWNDALKDDSSRMHSYTIFCLRQAKYG